MLSNQVIFDIRLAYILILCAYFIVGACYYGRLTFSLRCMVFLLAISFVTESIGFYMLFDSKRKNDVIFVAYQLCEYILMALYFSVIIRTKFAVSLIVLSGAVVVFMNMLILGGLLRLEPFNTWVFLLGAIFYIVWASTYLLEVFRGPLEEDIRQDPNFWICAGIIFFYSGSFFYMGLIHPIFKENEAAARVLSVLMILLNCILYGMITKGIICSLEKRNS